MKLKSLFLGSAAALALTSGALAADPRSSFVSLDVCDAYGITGLTIASSDTCLKISGSVSYEFRAGDYGTGTPWFGYYGDGGGVATVMNNDGTADWRSRLEAILKFEATTQTDAGAAKAVLTLRERQRSGGGSDVGDTGHSLRFQDAYVSFGDTTVIMAGMKGSIGKFGSDEPHNWLGLFNSNEVDTGVDWKLGRNVRTGGTSIQLVTEFADGISAGVGLENINRWDEGPGFAYVRGISEIVTDVDAGTLVGFVEAKGGWGDAHLTIMVDDALNGFRSYDPVTGVGSVWAFHAGTNLTFEQFAVTAALSGNSLEYLNGLLSAKGTFDLFTLAGSVEFASVGAGNPTNLTGSNLTGLGFGASVGFQVTDDVELNLGARYWDADTGNVIAGDTAVWEVAAGVSAVVAEGLTASGRLGYRGASATAVLPLPNDGDFYAQVGLGYKPGGGFETGASLEVNSLGGYRVNFDAKKSF